MNTLPLREAKSKFRFYGLVRTALSQDGAYQNDRDFGGTLARGHAVGMLEWSGCNGQVIHHFE